MPYLNLDVNYFDHPKTKRLVLLLGPMTDVLPLRLFAYCAKIHPLDGFLRGYSEFEINGLLGCANCEFTSGGGTFTAVQGLTETGFLKKVRNGFMLVEWLDHNGHLAAFSQRGKAANKRRWDMVKAGIPVGVLKDKQGVHTESIKDPPTIPTIPNQTNYTKPTITTRRTSAPFVPPSLDDVRSYFADRKTVIDPEQFHAHYEANGWMIGKARVKNWKACLTTWEKNNGFSKDARGASPVRTAATPGKYAGLEEAA